MESNSGTNTKLFMKNGLTLSQQMFSSCAGAFITTIFMTPFDVVKVRLQAQQQALLSHSKHCFVYSNGLMDHLCTCSAISTHEWYNRKIPVHLNGTVDAFKKIVKVEGYGTLWSGLPPTLIVAIPNTIIYLTTYEQLLKGIEYFSNNQQPMWAGGVAGGLARGWSVTVVSPVEMLRTKVQANSTLSYKSILNLIKNEVKSAGARKALWKGWVATILRDVPFSSFYWLSYENLKRICDQKYPSVPFALTAGAAAGGAAAMLTLPMDVVKTHQQIEIGEEIVTCKTKGGSNVARSTSEVLFHIYQKQGIMGLYTGVVPRLAKVMPACAVMIASYEYAKSYFRKRNYVGV